MAGKQNCTTIVRFSVAKAMAEVLDGGTVQYLARGGAEVWNADSCCVGYLTKKDYPKYLAATEKRKA